MGLVKQCILHAMRVNRDSVIDVATIRTGYSGNAGKINIPKWLARKDARRVIFDDGDDIVIVTLISKDQLDVDPRDMHRKRRIEPKLETVFDPQLASEYKSLMLRLQQLSERFAASYGRHVLERRGSSARPGPELEIESGEEEE